LVGASHRLFRQVLANACQGAETEGLGAWSIVARYRRGRSGGRPQIDEIDMHRLGEVLDGLFALVDELDFELVADLLTHHRRTGNAATPRQRFQPENPGRALLIGLPKSAVADHSGCQNSCEAALSSFFGHRRDPRSKLRCSKSILNSLTVSVAGLWLGSNPAELMIPPLCRVHA